MTSWRETTSEAVQGDLDGLLSSGLEVAQQTLAAQGQLAAFAVALQSDGQGLLIGVDPASLSAEPGAEEVRQGVLEAVRSGAAAYRAVAVFCDVLADGHDAVRVDLEHREGSALVVMAPYERADGAVSYGELSAAPATPVLWA